VKSFGPPMTLAVIATYEACGRQADVNVDALSAALTVPKARPAPPMQRVRRQGDIDQARLA
jgi:hypothetical protein